MPRKQNIWVEGSVGFIEIIRRTGEIFLVKFDADLLPEIQKYRWYVNFSTTSTSQGYIRSVDRDPSKRLILSRLVTSAPPDMMVDHKDHDLLNNPAT